MQGESAALDKVGHVYDPDDLGFLDPAVEVRLCHGFFVRVVTEDVCREVRRMVWQAEVARCDS